MFNSNQARTTPATLDRCRGNNRVGNLADVSIRAEELERFVEPWPMRDAGLVVADGAAVKPVMPRSSDIRIPAGRCESANRAEERDHRFRATEMMIVSAGSHDGRS
jgi:hypothetical protein